MGEVSLIDVSKRFSLRIEGKPQIVRALDRLNFTVSDGEVVALIGPSGCGKTTALRIAMGLETATSGAVTIDGVTIKGCGYDRGIVFQHAELLPWLTALQNVEFGLEMKGMRGAALRDTAMKYLTLVGLADSVKRRPYQLSGGMQQRVGIARALAIDPKVLLMDEPFGALDAQTRETLQSELLEIHARTKKTILFVTHDLDEAVLLADRVVVMEHGRLQEIFTVPLPRPRGDLSAIRGSDVFAQTRYRVWRALHAGAQPLH
ncbi:MAG TPA: ABC transporter ATP-binding protein [Xanthobacteraceae bacterium]|jgi:NitT/TauT family transport system ATP-binding protein|nr:ABC transporter ATP-binding protein [Xanthobacteraceae bacterium]